ncbi:MAG: hypothetical protein ABI352_09365 [Candidatus Dormibacter sp.]
MNLTLAEIRELPLAAALLDGDDLLAHTPEWRNTGPGAVTFPVRGRRLVVSTDATHPMCGPVVARLLAEIDGMATSLPRRQSLRVTMLADSLRIVAGRGVSTTGASTDVLEHACAGIASRTSLSVSVDRCDDFAVAAPSVAALVLVQFAVNAERHDRAESIVLAAGDETFTVGWHGSRGAAGAVTARRRAERARWGLGFARIATDAIGGVMYPPAELDGGQRIALLEVGLHHLALPLAVTRGGAVQKATRAWDEETALLPGTSVPPDSRAARCADAAAAVPGEIVGVDGWSARSVAGATWIAIPPDAIVDRARDVLDGMVHERALWDNVPEPGRSRIVALAAILAAMLGAELERVPGETWNRRAPDVAAAYGLTTRLPQFDGAGAVDPRVALFLAREFGDRLDADGDDLYLRIAAEHRDDPLVRVFLAPGDDSLKLS